MDAGNGAGGVSGYEEQSTIIGGQLSGPRDPLPDDETMELGHNEWENGANIDDLGSVELSEILSEAGEGSAAAGVVLGTRITSSSSVHSIAGANEEEKDDGDDRTDPESGGVHVDPANPFSLPEQEVEGGEQGDGDSTES